MASCHRNDLEFLNCVGDAYEWANKSLDIDSELTKQLDSTTHPNISAENPGVQLEIDFQDMTSVVEEDTPPTMEEHTAVAHMNASIKHMPDDRAETAGVDKVAQMDLTEDSLKEPDPEEEVPGDFVKWVEGSDVEASDNNHKASADSHEDPLPELVQTTRQVGTRARQTRCPPQWYIPQLNVGGKYFYSYVRGFLPNVLWEPVLNESQGGDSVCEPGRKPGVDSDPGMKYIDGQLEPGGSRYEGINSNE